MISVPVRFTRLGPAGVTVGDPVMRTGKPLSVELDLTDGDYL